MAFLRIQPLSDALGELYSEFNTLKERLADLTTQFNKVEAFVDGVRTGRKPDRPRGPHRPLPGTAEAGAKDARGRAPGRRVVVRRVVVRPVPSKN